MARPIAEEFGRAFRQAYEDAGLTQVTLAAGLQEHGWVKVDQSQISKWARGLLVPPLEILPDVDAVCRRPKGYVLRAAGYVEDDPSDVRAAIAADPQLDEDDREALTLLYDVFKKRASQQPAERPDPFSRLPGRRDVAAQRTPKAG